MFFEIEEIELGISGKTAEVTGKSFVFVPSIEIVRPIVRFGGGEFEIGPLVIVTFQSGRNVYCKNFIRKPSEVALVQGHPGILGGGLHS